VSLRSARAPLRSPHGNVTSQLMPAHLPLSYPPPPSVFETTTARHTWDCIAHFNYHLGTDGAGHSAAAAHTRGLLPARCLLRLQEALSDAELAAALEATGESAAPEVLRVTSEWQLRDWGLEIAGQQESEEPARVLQQATLSCRSSLPGSRPAADQLPA
jgi:hypothetical protein